jgi:hypothetical protein
VFPDALPDQPGAADLGHGGGGEQDQGTKDGHAGKLTAAGPVEVGPSKNDD